MYVAERLPAAIRSAIAAAGPSPSDVCQSLRDAIVAVDGDYLARPTTGAEVGACLVAAVLWAGSVYVGGVGDCRVVMVRQRGATAGGETITGLALTVDHTARNPGECARVARRSRDPHPIRRAQDGDIPRVAGSLAITRSLGDR